MWFQVELPEATNVAEVQIDAAAPGGGFLVLTPPGRGAAAGQAPAGAPAGRGAPPAAGGGRGRGGFQPPARGPVGYRFAAFHGWNDVGESGRAGRRRDSHDHHDVCPGTGEIQIRVHADRHRGEQRDLWVSSRCGSMREPASNEQPVRSAPSRILQSALSSPQAGLVLVILFLGATLTVFAGSHVDPRTGGPSTTSSTPTR